MGLLHKFFERSWRGKALSLRALYLVSGVRVGLWVLPYRTVQRLVEHPLNAQPLYPPATPDAWAYQQSVVAAVEGIGRRLLGEKPCLTQALVVQRMLRQAGYDTSLHFGVTKAEGELLAHAWLEQGDIVIVGGGASPAQYTPLSQARLGTP